MGIDLTLHQVMYLTPTWLVLTVKLSMYNNFIPSGFLFVNEHSEC